MIERPKTTLSGQRLTEVRQEGRNASGHLEAAIAPDVRAMFARLCGDI